MGDDADGYVTLRINMRRTAGEPVTAKALSDAVACAVTGLHVKAGPDADAATYEVARADVLGAGMTTA